MDFDDNIVTYLVLGNYLLLWSAYVLTDDPSSDGGDEMRTGFMGLVGSLCALLASFLVDPNLKDMVPSIYLTLISAAILLGLGYHKMQKQINSKSTTNERERKVRKVPIRSRSIKSQYTK
jgi:hypothetical protein